MAGMQTRPSRWIVAAIRLLIPVAIVVGVLLAAVVVSHRGEPTDIGGVLLTLGPDKGPYTNAQLFVGLLPAALFLYALFRLWRLFGCFVEARYFSLAAVGHLRAFAAMYATSVVFSGVVSVGLRWWRHASDAPLDIEIDGTQIWQLAMALIFFVIAYVLSEARKNAEELGDYF